MRIRHHPHREAAMLLMGVAALHALLGLGRPWAEPDPPAPALARSLPPPGSKARIALERCEENVTMIHDVHWAAACSSNAEDDSVDCTLPDARARPLNAARAAAEEQCLAEAIASRGPQ